VTSNRADVRDFLAARRARLRPEQVGLPAGNRRRVTGLRREEVAILAGVSAEWYTRLEKGHITGVSEDVLASVSRALRLDEDEQTYLLDLARAARSSAAHAGCRQWREAALPEQVQWMLDAMTMAAAVVTNGRWDVLASNALGRALYGSALSSGNLARYHFTDPGAHDFYADWGSAATIVVALLRPEAGRNPCDLDLRDLVDELSTASPDFRTRWAAHDILLHNHGTKSFRHPDVGTIELAYHSMELPTVSDGSAFLTTYTAAPGSASEEKFKVLASWKADGVGKEWALDQ
jgi:transcriptional regulator with XRE-family HTH domain